MYLIHIIYVIEDMDNDGRISQETNTKNSQHAVSTASRLTEWIDWIGCQAAQARLSALLMPRRRRRLAAMCASRLTMGGARTSFPALAQVSLAGD